MNLGQVPCTHHHRPGPLKLQTRIRRGSAMPSCPLAPPFSRTEERNSEKVQKERERIFFFFFLGKTSLKKKTVGFRHRSSTMLRRCIWELSSGRSVGTNRRMIPAQMHFFLASRKDFSNSSQKKLSQTPAPAEKTSGSGNISAKVVIGSLLLGGAVLAAYQTGYIDLNINDKKSSIPSKIPDADIVSKDLKHSDEQTVVSNNEEPTSKPNMEIVEENEPHHHKGFDPETKPAEEETVPVGEKELSATLKETTPFPQKQTSDHKVSESSLNMENVVVPKTDMEENIASKNSTKQSDGSDSSFHISEETGIREAATDHAIPMEAAKDSPDNEIMPQKSLADTYEGISRISDERERTDVLTSFLKDKETSIATSGNLEDKNKPKDDKILLGFLEAIHAAEKRQAESDARIFAEEKRMLKEKYEKELKDARARELMYAEEAAILDKELNKEKVKAAATMKMLQEKAEQKLQEELQRKAEEAEMELKKVQELAKAELAAAIASEKAAQIEKIAEANLHINALCMAFYARSEEARQSHSIHKLALGTLALEDALSKGLPIRAEVDALHKSLDGIDRDSLLDLTLSSLPEEALNHGADTLMQLDQKFDSLKGTLRHFSLIPAGGGGLLAHTVAHIASSIKMKEDQHGDGIESVISKVESFLVQGKLAEAADALEGGVHGSKAQEVVAEWVRRARNRAMVEQALSLLQSYATSITFS